MVEGISSVEEGDMSKGFTGFEKCVCGHESDEHEDGFFNPCTVEDCDCDDCELTDDEDEESE